MNEFKYCQINLEPADLLFFRDARPMEAGWTGLGGNWPDGRTFHGAIQSALQRFFQVGPRDEQSLSSLCTIGPFPSKNGELYFPMPLDVLPGGETLIPTEQKYGRCNLPAPLSMVLKNPGTPSKEKVSPWISTKQLTAYLLDGKLPDAGKFHELFDVETFPGIAIDKKNHCVIKHKFFSAEYLRLRKDVFISGFARLNKPSAMEQCFQAGSRITLGGQQCTASVREFLLNPPGLFSNPNSGVRVKWVLLTPAGYGTGWLPNFVNPADGQVMLNTDILDRQSGEPRKMWRKRCFANISGTASIKATLVAARVGTAIPVSGWNQVDCEPRPTRLLVPAGSVYYFEAASPEDAKKLVAALSGRCRSEYGSEYGYGFGVCTTF